MGLTYYSPVRDGDIVYSCDMLRLKFHIDKFRAQQFYDYLHVLELRFDYWVDYFKSNKIGTYKHLFSCKYDGGNFTFGCDLQENVVRPGINCMIEFNPNKNDMIYMLNVLKEFAYYIKPIDGLYYQLMRFDLAVDIPVDRNNVVLLKKGKREYHRIISSSLTEYIGKRNTNGFTKVYDKQSESNLDNELTRVEVTCDDFDTFSLPEIVLLQDNTRDDFTELNSTDIVLINLIRRLGEDEQQQALKSLGRTKREKLQKHIFPYEQKFNFNMGCIFWVTSFIRHIMALEQSECINYNVVEEESVKSETYKQYNLFN